MKKVNALFICLLLVIAVGCSRSNNGSLRNYFSKIESLNNTVIEEFANFKENNIILNDYQGGLGTISAGDTAIIFYMLNNDLRFKQVKSNYTDIEVLNDATILTMPEFDEFDLVMACKDNQNIVDCYIEIAGQKKIFEDKAVKKVIPLTFSKSGVKVGNNIVYDNVSLDNIDTYYEKIRNIGLEIVDSTQPLYKQNIEMNGIFTISRKHIAGFDKDIYLDSGNEKVKYGETSFKILGNDHFKDNGRDEITDKIEYNDTYLGDYFAFCEDGYLFLKLEKQDYNVKYSLNHYLEQDNLEKDKLFGVWSKENKILDIQNENLEGIFEYSFNSIRYLDNAIEVEIVPKKANCSIKKGVYTFFLVSKQDFTGNKFGKYDDTEFKIRGSYEYKDGTNTEVVVFNKNNVKWSSSKIAKTGIYQIKDNKISILFNKEISDGEERFTIVEKSCTINSNDSITCDVLDEKNDHIYTK